MRHIAPYKKNMKVLEDTLSFIKNYLDKETCKKFNLPYLYDEIDSGKIDYGISYFYDDLFPAFEYVIEKLKNNPEYKAVHTHEESQTEIFEKLDVEQVYRDLKIDVKLVGRNSFHLRYHYPRKKLKKYDYEILMTVLCRIGKLTTKQLNMPHYLDNEWNENMEEEIEQDEGVLIKSMRDMGYTIDNLLEAVAYLLKNKTREKYLDQYGDSIYDKWEDLFEKLYEVSTYINCNDSEN
ncbi:MAG: hypothetical protein IKC49_02835 [Clostridia bacterium]|nr:hypothetical protein [bacterium]MBR2969971.1 hypothetical protein [Clostridia bacterium]